MGTTWIRALGSGFGTALMAGFTVYKGQDWIQGVSKKNHEKLRERWASGRPESTHRDLANALEGLSPESARVELWRYAGRMTQESPSSSKEVLKEVGDCSLYAKDGWDAERCRLLRDIVKKNLGQ